MAALGEAGGESRASPLLPGGESAAAARPGHDIIRAMRRRWLAGLILAALAAAGAAAAERSFTFGLSGGLLRFPAYGSNADYLRGENDFPVTPAHTAVGVGLSFGRAAGAFLFEVEARWSFPGSVVLRDPSDGDTASVSTATHVSAVLNALFSPFRGAWRPYVEAGGGLDAVLTRAETVTTAYGYRIDRPALRTADRFDPEAHIGSGLLVSLGVVLALRLDVRAVWIFEEPRALHGLQAGGGLILRF
jgi:hypothetical protein